MRSPTPYELAKVELRALFLRRLLFERSQIGRSNFPGGDFELTTVGQNLLAERRQLLTAAARATHDALDAGHFETLIKAVDQKPRALIVHVHRARGRRDRAGRLRAFEKCGLTGANASPRFENNSNS
ncbi:MAG: hypothetical protein ACLPIG_04215 [Methylocella sp.]